LFAQVRTLWWARRYRDAAAGRSARDPQELAQQAPDVIAKLERGEAVLSALKLTRSRNGLYLSALLATDVTKFTSLLFVDAEKAVLAGIGYPKAGEKVFVLKDVLSRKKQLMPMIFELMEKARES